MDFLCEKLSWLTLRPAPIKYHGLMNQGATCYLNSVLQVLFMTKDFREAVERSMSEDTERIDRQLKDLFDDLKNYTAYTYKITKKLNIDRVYEQRDAAEYLEKILALTSDEASRIFHGELTHKTICSKGHTEKSTNGKFWHLPLELVKSNSETYCVVNGTQEYFRDVSFSGENRMYCDECDDKSDATTKCELKDPPEVLTLLLKRFEFDYYYMMYIKNNCVVDVPCSLQILESHMYELYAVVDHWGDLRSGHYTATVKSQDDERWYNFNDTTVRLLERQPFQGRNTEEFFSAYLLFYRKKKTHAADTCAHDTMDVSTNGFLPDARVNDNQSQDAETGGEREEEKKTEVGEDTAELVSIDRNGKTETSDMVSVESREQELSSDLICHVEHQDNGDGVRQRRLHGYQKRKEEGSELNNQKLEPTGAELTPARRNLPMYNYFLEGFQSKHNMPEDDGGCKQGSDMYEGPEQQRRDVKGYNEQSKADDDDPAQRKGTFTSNHNLGEGLWDYSERRLHDVRENRPEQKICVSYPTHPKQAKEQESKVDEQIQNREDSERRNKLTESWEIESVEKMKLGNCQPQESAVLNEVVVVGTGRQIYGRIIDEEIKDTPNGLQRCSETKTITIVTKETSTKVSIRSQADDGGSTDCSELSDSPQPEQQTHRDTTVFVNAKEENETNCTIQSNTRETQDVSDAQMQTAGIKYAMKKEEERMETHQCPSEETPETEQEDNFS